MTGEVLARYDVMRAAALADAQERLTTRISVPVKLSVINETALKAWQEQWSPRPGSLGGWNWREQRLRLRSSLNRFEVAVWSGGTLCGLAIGKPSDGPSHLAVRLLEGNPAQTHPLKGFVAECVAEAGISYGRLLGKAQLRFLHPLPGALPTYRRLNFHVEPGATKPSYCYREI